MIYFFVYVVLEVPLYLLASISVHEEHAGMYVHGFTITEYSNDYLGYQVIFIPYFLPMCMEGTEWLKFYQFTPMLDGHLTHTCAHDKGHK